MTRLTTLIKLILLLFSSSYGSPISKLIDVAVNITSTYYKPHFVTAVVWNHYKSDCVNEFLNKYPGSVVLSPWFDDNDNHIRDINETVGFRQTIYFTTTLTEYSKFMKLMNEITRFRNIFIIVLENVIVNASELSAFNEVAWKNDQSNLVIISANDSSEITISTYFPYSKSICKNYKPVFLKSTDNILPKKFTNFYGCPIRVSLIQIVSYAMIETKDGIMAIGGHDGEIFMIILNKLNASLNVTSADKYATFGTYVNGTVSGSIDDLHSDRADILIPGGLLTLNRYSVTTPSHIYHTVDIRWIGPKQRKVYDWLKMIVPDRTNFTYLHGITFACFVIVAMLIRRCKTHLFNGKSSILFQSFIILLGQSAKFVTQSSLLNMFFLLWIWFCFIFRIDYQADLVETLQNTDLEPPVRSIEEAVEQNYGYGGSEVHREYYKDTPLEQNYKVLTLTEITSYFQRIFKGERFFLASGINFLPELHYFSQVIKKRITSSGICIYMRSGWPAANDVDSIIIRLVESGIVEKLMSDSDNKWLRSKLRYFNYDDLNAKGLSMTTISTCFYGLALMWVICTIILVIEIIYHKYTFKKYYAWVD